MLEMFKAASLAIRVGIVVAALAAVGGIYAYWHHSVYQAGRDYQTNLIAAKDKEATDAADRAASNFRECRDAGGLWRPSSGDCQRR